MIGQAVAGRPRDVEGRETIHAAFMNPQNAGIGMKGMIALTGASRHLVYAVRDDLLAAGAISRDALKRETAEDRARAAMLTAPDKTNAELAVETGLPVHAFSNARAKLRRSGKFASAVRAAKRDRVLAAWREGERRSSKIADLAGASKGYVNHVLRDIGADRGAKKSSATPSRTFNNMLHGPHPIRSGRKHETKPMATKIETRKAAVHIEGPSAQVIWGGVVLAAIAFFGWLALEVIELGRGQSALKEAVENNGKKLELLLMDGGQ